MEALGHLDSLSLREKKKYAGMPENWKLKPVCCLSDISEHELYYAAPEGGRVADMATLRKTHALTLYLLDKTGEELLCFKKHAGLFKNKIEIFDASEGLLGTVQKYGSSKAHFQVFDAGGGVLYDVEGVSETPEIFHIKKEGITVGRISRRPTRIAEEGASRNDPFGIVFPLDAAVSEKSLLLGALFLIDLLF